jgi:RimJ/RimL family protein N-acetyltransferase
VPSIPLDLTLADGELTLSRPTADDVDTLVTACNDPEIQRFTQVPTPYTRDSARWFVDLGWRDLDGEVGFWVAPWARRQGVATHAARVVCRWAFEEAGIERLDLEAATINLGSNGVARRLGFTLEGTRRAAAIEGATGEPGTERMDMNVWGLLPGELT